MRAPRATPWLALEAFAGLMLLSCHDSSTDWLVRGADAELAFMMIAPWFLAWCIVLICEGRWRLSLGPLLAVEALAHLALTVFQRLPLGLAVLPVARPMVALSDYPRIGDRSWPVCSALASSRRPAPTSHG